jgi:hypothetical protein
MSNFSDGPLSRSSVRKALDSFYTSYRSGGLDESNNKQDKPTRHLLLIKAAQNKSVREQFTRNGGIERSRGSRNLMGDLELTSNHDRKPPESSRPSADFDVDPGSSADDDGDDLMVPQQQKLQEKLLNDLMLHDVAGPTAPVIDRFVRRRRSIAFGGVRGGVHATNGIETELEMAHLALLQNQQAQTMDDMSKKISEMMELLKAQQNKGAATAAVAAAT